MRIALIGSSGQLGTDLQNMLPDDVVPLTHSDIELSNDASVDECLTRVSPDLVINTAAYNLVDRAEDEPAAAFEVNAFGPRRLAKFCGERQIPLVHFSSDYVFGLDADRSTPYPEDDAPGPQSVYAASKLQGEYFVRSFCERHFVIRTCGLYGIAATRGAGKGNFIETMIRLGRDRDRLTVVNDQRCTPTATLDLAEAVAELMRTEQYGLYHVTNSGSMTWFELAGEVFRREGIEVDLAPITSDEFGAAAPRPGYSVLDTGKVESVLGRKMPAWQDALDRYLTSRNQ